MTKKTLEAAMKITTEAYEQAVSDIERGYRTKKEIYDVYFASIYSIEGMVDILCNSDEKVEWTSMLDKQHKIIRKLLKM